MTSLTITAITDCYRTEKDGTKTFIGYCLKLQKVNTCSLGSQRVKGGMTYLFFTPATSAEVGEVHELDLSDQGPFTMDLVKDLLEDGKEVSHTKLWLK